MGSQTDADLVALARAAGERLAQSRYLLATAESCTGGWIAQALTSVPGSSGWFDRGFVTYSNAAKCEMLGVDAALLARFGAVSAETARAMAEGALARARAQVALAVTGIAGPSGGAPEKPVGTVWFAWAGAGRKTLSRRHRFDGDRQAIRRQAVAAALEGLIEFLRG